MTQALGSAANTPSEQWVSASSSGIAVWVLFAVILAGPDLLPWQQGYQLAVEGGFLIAAWYAYQNNLLSNLKWHLLLPILGLMVWTLCSLLWSDGINWLPVFLEWLPAVISVLLFTFMVAVIATDDKRFANTLLFVTLLISALALFSLYWQFVVLGKSLAYRSYRIAGSGLGDFGNLYNPIDAGLYYGVFAVVLIHRLCLKGSLLFKALLVVALLPLLVYISLTYSRGAIFSLVAACLVMACLVEKRLGLLIAGSWLVIATALVLVGDWLLSAEVQKGFNGREPIWQYAFELIRQKPLMGHGLGQIFDYVIPPYNVVHHFAHNYLLTLWVHYGAIGLLLFLAGMVACIRQIWRYRHQPLADISCWFISLWFYWNSVLCR